MTSSQDIIDEMRLNINNNFLQRNIALLDSLNGNGVLQSLSCLYRGRVYHQLGVSLYLLDREEEAIEIFRDSVLWTWENCEVPLSEKANTIYNIGISYQYTDEPLRGKAYIDKALLIFEKDTSYTAEDLVLKYQGAGNYFADMHEIVRAESYYQSALQMYAAIPESKLERLDILNRLIILNLDLKRYEEAYSYYLMVLDALQSSEKNIEPVDQALLYLNGANVLLELGKNAAAKEAGFRALGLLNKTNQPGYYSNGLELLGMIEKKSGQFSDALLYYHQALVLRENNRNDMYSAQSRANALENISEIYYEQEEYIEAMDYIDRALMAINISTTMDSVHNPSTSISFLPLDLDVIRLLSIKSKIVMGLYNKENNEDLLNDVLLLYHKIDTIVNRSVIASRFDMSKLSLYEVIVKYYSDAVRDAIRLYRATGDISILKEAYYFSSKSKALILSSKIRSTRVREAYISKDLILEEKRLLDILNSLREKLMMHQDVPDSLLRNYVRAQLDLEVFVEKLETDYPEYYKSKYALIRPLGIKDIQDRLPEEQLIVEYCYTSDSLYSFWITRDSFFCSSVANDDWLRQNLDKFNVQCRDPLQIYEPNTGRRAYVALLSSGLKRLDKSVTDICVIPDGMIHSIPFDAMVSSSGDSHRYLVEDYVLSVSYSTQILFKPRNQNRSIEYIGFGTYYSSGLNEKLQEEAILPPGQNLPLFNIAEEEIQNAAKLWGGVSFTARDASVENFLRYVVRANILHLSLHGLVNYDDGFSSSLIFDDRNREFVLTALDLDTVSVQADLVVLSSCHSASGQIYQGEGVNGLSRAFLQAGASNVVSSLWSASERGSAQILSTLFTQMKKGQSPTRALQEAKYQYLNQATPSLSHPFYWANYILIGSIDQNASSEMSIIPFLGAILLAIATLMFWRYSRRKKM